MCVQHANRRENAWQIQHKRKEEEKSNRNPMAKKEKNVVASVLAWLCKAYVKHLRRIRMTGNGYQSHCFCK